MTFSFDSFDPSRFFDDQNTDNTDNSRSDTGGCEDSNDDDYAKFLASLERIQEESAAISAFDGIVRQEEHSDEISLQGIDDHIFHPHYPRCCARHEQEALARSRPFAQEASRTATTGAAENAVVMFPPPPPASSAAAKLKLKPNPKPKPKPKPKKKQATPKKSRSPKSGPPASKTTKKTKKKPCKASSRISPEELAKIQNCPRMQEFKLKTNLSRAMKCSNETRAEFLRVSSSIYPQMLASQKR